MQISVMGKPSTDENGLGGGVVSYRESPARPPPEAQTSFEIFNSRNVSGVEGIAALALLACGQSASRSEGRVDSHSWDELLGSGGEPTGNCISSLVPLLTENSSGASTRSSSNTSTSSSGGESSLVGGDGNNNRSKASRPSGCIGDDPGPMPVRRPFERRPGASGAVAGNAGGGNDRRRHRTTRNSWDLKVSAVASTFHRDTPVRDTGLDHAHACEQPPWVRPGTPDPATGVYRGDGRGGYGGDVRRVLSETRHSKPMLRCPSFDPHKDVDLPLEVSSWSGTSTDVHSPLRSGITVAGNRTAGGVEAGVAIGGGGGGTEVAAANCPPEWTHAPPLRGDTSTRGTEAAAPTSVSGGSAVTPSWMLQPVEDKSPNVQKPSFDALKMMIPGLESFTGGGRGAAVSSGGIAPGSRVAPGRTDGMLQTPSTLPMSGEGPGTPSTTSHTISGMPLGQGVPGEPSMLGGIGSLKRPFSAVEGSDNGKAGALARPTEMLTPRQVYARFIFFSPLDGAIAHVKPCIVELWKSHFPYEVLRCFV